MRPSIFYLCYVPCTLHTLHKSLHLSQCCEISQFLFSSRVAALLPCEEDRQKKMKVQVQPAADPLDTGGHLEFLVAVSQPEEGEVGAGDEMLLESEMEMEL